MSVSIDSRENQDGYIDYSQDSLFVGLPTINGTGVDVSKSSFSWSLADSLGIPVDLTNALMVQNSLKIPAKTLSMNQIYILSLSVTSGNVTGSVSISYNTNYDTKYSFEVTPSSGVAFDTEFIVSAVSQEIDSLLTSFIFGYIKGGKEYYLTRNSPVPTHRVQLPQGETSNELTLFMIVSNNDEKFRFETKLTVSATPMTSDNFINELSTVYSNSVDESMNLHMKYVQFKDSLGTSKATACNSILNGFQVDGSNAQSGQDEQTKKSIAQALEMISSDLSSIGDSTLASRTLSIFEKFTITENNQISNNYTIEFSTGTFESLAVYADNVLSVLHLFSDETLTKSKLLQGMENLVRGSMSKLAPGDKAYSYSGSNLSIMCGKITASGYTGTAIFSPTTMNNSTGRNLNIDQMSINIPGSAMPKVNYLQLSVIVINKQGYTVAPFYSEGQVKQYMARINLEENDLTIANIGNKVYSKRHSVSDLKDPIVINIPFSGSIGEKNTLS